MDASLSHSRDAWVSGSERAAMVEWLPPRERALVLLVDDDPSSRYATGRVLRQADLDVIEASSGRQALERVAARPDLIVLDVGLPDMDGFELCSRLRSVPGVSHAQILYLSARYPHTEDRVRGLECGGDAYLSQPADPRELIAVVRTLLRNWRTAHALAESEARFRAVQEASPAGFALMEAVRDEEGRVVDFVYRYLNPAGEAILRKPAAELVGKRMLDVHPSEVGSGFLERYSRVVETGTPDETEVGCAAQGPGRWLRVTMARVEDGVAVNFSDVTAQKGAELAREQLMSELTHERERLQTLFAEAPALISVCRGPDHIVEMANPGILRTAGRHDILGLPMGEAFPELLGQGFVGLLDRVYRTGLPFTGSEVPSRLDRDGDGGVEERFYNLVFQPLRDGEGRTTGIMTFAVDVTDQVLARREVEEKAEQLGRLTRALEISNRELDQYAFVISHDLKAPLRAIASYAAYLEADLAEQVDGETRLYLERLRNRVERLQAMIEAILAYSRAGRDPRTPERIELESALTGIVELLEPPPGFSLEVDSQPRVLVAERAPLEQVLRNLIDNAIKHARRPDPRVRVSVVDSGNVYAFAIEDNGPGIPLEVQDRIWTLFHTLESSDDPDATGIGLAVVKKLVEARGGRVWVESAPGAGSVFRFLWPKRARAAA